MNADPSLSLNASHAPLHASLSHRLARRIFEPVLDRIDAGLVQGSLQATLPGGDVRMLGGRNPGPVAIVDLNRWRALARLAHSGSVGWYEAWAAGEWSSPDPVPLFDLFMRNRVTLGQAARAKGVSRLAKRARHALRRNHPRGASRNIHAHYDLGNAFYAAWLDPTMSYSSAMFTSPDQDLEAAQLAKTAAIIDRIGPADGADVLEIGCGWGHLARTLADRGAKVTAITLSPGQFAHARALSADVDWRLADYRSLTGQFDAIVSVEMVEAVGQAYWPTFLDTIARCLKPGGRAAIQYISIADDIFEHYAQSVDFIQRYVFPGGMLLSQGRFKALAQARGLVWTDQRDFGHDYAETLRRWRLAFDGAAQGRLPAGFDASFVALWRYYLMYCEGGFMGGGIQVSQATLIKEP